MERLIPLHSLVVLAEPPADDVFPPHEVVDMEVVAWQIAGPRQVRRLAEEETIRRCLMKLSLGERAVAVLPVTERELRSELARRGAAFGVPVFYAPPPGTQISSDGLAEIIRPPYRAVLELPEDATGRIARRFKGITVFGDIHGMHHTFLGALSWARSREHFVWFLGDVVDCGPGTLEVADEVYRIVMRGQGAMIMGNHERKIARLIEARETGRRDIKLSEGNKVTADALDRMSKTARQQWIGRFRGLIWRSDLIRDVGSITLTHAAVHPSYWQDRGAERLIETYALFGETDLTRHPRWAQGYQWIDAVPEGRTVIVGHDTRSAIAPLTVTGAAGGKVVFLDTGCAKGGPLSSADLRFGEDGVLRLENLNVH